MVYIEPRSVWGARYANGDRNLGGLAEGVFMHHTAMSTLPADATVEEERAEMRRIEAVGQGRFGFGISYNVIFFMSGRAYEGCSWNRRGAHTAGLNSVVRSICLAGDYEKYEPSAAQLAGVTALFAEGKGKWWKHSAYLKGHRDHKSTACPGRNVYKYLPSIRNGSAGSGASPAPAPAPAPSTRNYLAKGDSGSAVRELQQQLINLGYNLGRYGADGSYGNDTVNAVKALQSRAGLTADGIAGPDTRAAIARGVRAVDAPVAPAPAPSGITVDGLWGADTTRALQRALGTPVDGVISGQVRSSSNANLFSAQWGKGGSTMVKVLQGRLGVTADGYLGAGTIAALQRHLGTHVDGVVSNPSHMVKELQRRLNAGNLF